MTYNIRAFIPMRCVSPTVGPTYEVQSIVYLRENEEEVFKNPGWQTINTFQELSNAQLLVNRLIGAPSDEKYALRVRIRQIQVLEVWVEE